MTKGSDRRNILLFSIYFPPEAGGASTVYENLLQHLEQNTIFVISGYPFFRTSGSNLRCKVYRPVPVILARRPWGEYILLLFMPLIFLIGLIVIKIRKIDLIISTYPDNSFLITSYLIHKFTGIPLFVYLHDTFIETQTDLLCRQTAKYFQERIFRSASKIFVISEGMHEYYKDKYNLQTIVIPHCLSHELEYLPTGIAQEKTWIENRIVFSGAIYAMNLDSIRTMTETVASMHNTKFLISTFNPRALKRLGIDGHNVKSYYFPESDQLTKFLRESDILYLPLAFESPWPDEIISVFPTKTVEYLVAGVPILVHAPSHYYLTRFALQNGFALVVDENNSVVLHEALETLLRDENLRQELVKRALITAQNFEGRYIAQKLKDNLFAN